MQCRAKSKQSEKRCRKQAINGGTVCAMHGGKATQVKKKARERFNDLVDPAINLLAAVINNEKMPAASRVAAAKDILDRAGYKPVDKTQDVTPESKEAKALRKEFTLEDLRKIRDDLRRKS